MASTGQNGWPVSSPPLAAASPSSSMSPQMPQPGAGSGPLSLGITPHLYPNPEAPILPTVLISYRNPSGQTRTVKARIDRNVPLPEVIRQLCTSTQLSVAEPPALFALRDSVSNELVTHDNVFRKVEQGDATFKLVSSPVIEAAESVEKLATRDDRTMKMALFTLKDYLREPSFTEEFFLRGGSVELIGICRVAPVGNTLAYALSALQVLTELDHGWESLDAEMVARLASLLTHSTAVNVLRPTTAVMRKLVLSGPSARPFSIAGPVANDDSVFKYGFDAVWPAILLEDEFLKVLSRRVAMGGQGDFGLASATLGLVNALMKCSLSTSAFEDFDDKLERCDVRKAVLKLVEQNRGEELLPLVLGFQSNINGAANTLLKMPVKADSPAHIALLMEIATKSRELDSKSRRQNKNGAHLTQEEDMDVEIRQWKTAGFEAENLLEDFSRVGLLGLKLMARYVVSRPTEFEKLLMDQLARPEHKRCPFAKASNECTEILCELWDWNAVDSGTSPATVYHPFLLQYPRAHALALKFFFLMWTDSGATLTDFARVGVLVRTQVKSAFRNERRGWTELQKEFEDVDYTRVRDKQMQELALEDDLLSKPCVRTLRTRLYQESFDFIRNQRINSLTVGSWFLHNPSSQSSRKGGMPPAKVWRFYRLAANRRYLHYMESLEKMSIGAGTEDMPDRFEMTSITDVVAAAPAPGPTSPNMGTFRQNNSATSPALARSGSIRFSSYSTTADGTNFVNGMTSGHSTSSSNSIVSPGSAGFGFSNSTGTGTLSASMLTTGLSGGASGGGGGGMIGGMGGINQAGGGTASPLLGHTSFVFSLMSGDTVLAEMAAPDAATYSEWIDGLSLLRPDGYISTRETADLVHTLTQIGTQIKLLDLSGERVEVPQKLEVPPVPLSTEFFYADNAVLS